MIFFEILKIIGIILLVLLGILILAILLVLFYPVSYRIKGSYHKGLQMDGKITWLFHLLSMRFLMENQKEKLYLRVLWFKKVFRDDFAEHMNTKTASSNEADIDKPMKPNSKAAKKEAKQNKESRSYREEDFFDDEPEMEKGSDSATDIAVSDISDTKRGSEEASVKKRNSLKEIWIKVKNFFQTLWQKICSLCKTVEQLRDFMNDPNHRDAFGVLKSEAFHLLKAVCPSRMKLESTFSTGSPDRTGQALGILCLFPIAYQNRWRIYPDFESEEFYIEADFDVKGHVFIYQIIHIALKIILNKNCRQLYNDIRK